MIDEKGIRERLRELYSGPGWTVYEELARGGAQQTFGGEPSRSIDFFAHFRKPGVRQRFISIEVKSSRNDVSQELNSPSKRKVWESVSDECFFACPRGIVRPDQIPNPWGLITFQGDMVIHEKQPVWCKGYPDEHLALELGIKKSSKGNKYGLAHSGLSAMIDGGVAKAFIADAKAQGMGKGLAVTQALAEYMDRRHVPYHRSIPLDLTS